MEEALKELIKRFFNNNKTGEAFISYLENPNEERDAKNTQYQMHSKAKRKLKIAHQILKYEEIKKELKIKD